MGDAIDIEEKTMTAIDAAPIKKFIGAQFPLRTDFFACSVENDGHGKRTFRLGDAMAARLK